MWLMFSRALWYAWEAACSGGAVVWSGEVRQACRQDSVVHSRVKIAVYRPWSVMVSLLTEDDPEFSTLFRQILVDHRAKLVNVIDACKADGIMRVDIDPETLIDAIVGTYIAERAREGQVGDDWEDRLFAVFWPAVRT